MSAGHFVASNIAKAIPGLESAVGAITAATFTEGLGWVVADDFYRVSIEETPINFVGAIYEIKGVFSNMSLHNIHPSQNPGDN